MNIDLEDQSVLLRKIEQHRLREQNLSSLPSLEQTSDYEGSDDEEEKAQFEALRRRNREAREKEESDKENRGDLQDDNLETPVPTRVSKQPIYSQAQKTQRSTTPPFQPTNRVLDALKSPSASTASSDQLPSLPNESGSSSNGIPVSSTPAPSRSDLRHSDTASTIKPTSHSPLDASHKRFASTLRHRDDIRGGRVSVGSSANGSFSIAAIQHGETDSAYAEEQHSALYSNNSLDLPKLTDRDLPHGVHYRDYAIPIKGGEDSETLDEPTARRIRNHSKRSLNEKAALSDSPRFSDDRCDTSLEDQANFDYSHSERNDSETGQDMSDFTDGDEANAVREDVVDMVVRMPDETVDSNDSPAPSWVDARPRYRSQSPNLQRSALPRSPHPRALMASVNGRNDQERIPSLSRSASDDSDRSGSLDNVAQTPIVDFDEEQFGQNNQTPARQGTSKELPDTTVSVRTNLSALEDVPEEDEYSGRCSDGTTPARKTAVNNLAATPAAFYSPHHSTLSTPGVARNASMTQTPLQQTQPPSFDTMIRERSLRDITYSMQNGLYDSPAPSEYFVGSAKAGSLQTPKPGEKSRADFLLSRLESTSKPLRYKAIRGRMSAAGLGEFARSNQAEMSLLGHSVTQVQGPLGDGEFEVGEISGVSLSSSLDLTTDKRMSTARRGRGNMSVPEINLSDGGVQDGVNQSNLVKEMHLINIGLQQEYETVNREKEDLIRWCRSQGYQVPQQLLGDQQGLAAGEDEDSSYIRDGGDHDLKQRIRAAEEECQQKEDEISELKERLKVGANQDAEVQRLQQYVHSKEEQAETDRVRIQQLQRQLEEQDDMAEKEKAAFEADFRELEDKINFLTAERERLTHTLQVRTADEGHGQLQDELHDLRDELEKAMEQLQEYEHTIRDLQAKLENAHDENARFVGDAFQAEDAAKNASVTRQTLESDLEQQRNANDHLHEQIRNLENTVAEVETKLHQREEAEEDYRQELEDLTKRLIGLSAERDGLSSDKQVLQEEIDQLRQSLDATTEDLQHTEERYLQETRRAHDLQNQLDSTAAALQAAQAEVQSLERELDGRGDRSIADDNVRHMSAELAQAESKVKHLQERLKACEEELQRAQHQSANQARQMAVIRQKDVKIDALITEKTALMDRVRLLAEQQSNLSMAKDPKTPGKSATGFPPASPFGTLRPINRVLLNLRTPKTPGQLSEMTWLSGSSVGGAEESMMAQLQAMGEELKKANKHIDENFDELEKRGLLGCSLADELADAHSQIASLKERLQNLRKQHNGVKDQLISTECPGCDLVFDAAEPLRLAEAHAYTDFSDLAVSTSQPDRSRLRQSLSALREQYDGLQQEHRKQGKRYEAQILSLNEEIDSLVKEKMTVTELNRKTIAQLENDHVNQIRELRNDKEELDDEKHKVEMRLAGIQKELDSNVIKSKVLQRDLDAANMRIHGLKSEGSELRQENNSLAHEMSDMKTRLRTAEQAAQESLRLRSEIEVLQVQHQASRQRTASTEQERDRLKEQLIELNRRLSAADDKLAKEAKIHDNLRKQLSSLESSLKRHRKEAQEFSDALKAMQAQHDTNRDKANRADVLIREKEQAMRTIENLERQLATVESRTTLRSGTSMNSPRSSEVEDLHQTQSRLISDRKILTSQIRYLQSLYARENTFRDALLVQKQYLLRLVGQFRQTEQETLALIASMGYPPMVRKSHARFTLKSVALAVRFTVKMKASRDRWQQVLQQRPDRPQSGQ